MTVNIRFAIDQAFISQAEEEAYQVLMAQYGVYYDNWNSRIRPKLRMFGLLVTLFGLVISVLTIVYLKVTYSNAACVDVSTLQLLIYIGVLLILGGVFYFLPKQRKSIPNWAMKSATKNFKKIAHTCVKQAKKLVPFEAEYHIDGESISYYRFRNGERQLVWAKKLKGVAVHSKSITLFFKKRTTLSPIMVVLHRDFNQLKPALEQQNIEFIQLEQ